ncbi:MAG TPA: L-ribulose-5-phosphate 4-epimerase [Candidatus Acidoferrales bacterium]
MFELLREEVLEANLELVRRGLVLYTFGNASGIDREQGVVVIKPTGVPYEKMRPSDLVAIDLEGTIIEGQLRPSADLPTHLILYREFGSIGGVAHTHSRMATAWAQAKREIPCFGTTHADYFCGTVPVTEPLSADEISSDYEVNTGHSIARCFQRRDPESTPGVLVASHGPFTWGKTVTEAVHNSVVLEEIAQLAFYTITANSDSEQIARALHDKHFNRKHGSSAYYGQRKR